jgi:hypothetical protein
LSAYQLALTEDTDFGENGVHTWNYFYVKEIKEGKERMTKEWAIKGALKKYTGEMRDDNKLIREANRKKEGDM